MIHDLTSRYKLKGMKTQEAQKLLGPSDKDAEPWPDCSKHPDSPYLPYDLGHLTFKYGLCLVLYYDKDQTV